MGHPIDWFNRLDFRKAIWLAPLVWTLHEAEEWDINAFQRQHFADPGFLHLVDHGVLWIILGFVALVGIVWTCLTAWPKNPKFAAFLTLPVFIVFPSATSCSTLAPFSSSVNICRGS